MKVSLERMDEILIKILKFINFLAIKIFVNRVNLTSDFDIFLMTGIQYLITPNHIYIPYNLAEKKVVISLIFVNKKMIKQTT